MWQKITQRLTDPVFYRKRIRKLRRRFLPPRPANPATVSELLESLPADGRKICAITAHPDDEFFAAGLICEAAARQIPVEIVCLTRGEGGPLGDQTRETLGRKRESELRASATALGVGRITFLGHVDPIGKTFRTFAPAVSLAHLADQLRELISDRRPGLIVTHGSGGEYWHPAHLLLHHAVFHSIKTVRFPRPAIATFQAWQPHHPMKSLLNEDDPADLILETAAFRDKRLAALAAHESQSDYFSQISGGSLADFVDRTQTEGYRLYGFKSPRPEAENSDRLPDPVTIR
ncbi:MAG: PIG-L family deacetylase [Verrucomicrobiae bacterium]|nr:PIG-L family deacetylase [Verrucomicrobiae bacterium]